MELPAFVHSHFGFEGGTISQWYPNQSGGDIPYLLVFQQNGGRVSWSARPGGLKSGESMDLAESALTTAADGFPAPV